MNLRVDSPAASGRIGAAKQAWDLLRDLRNSAVERFAWTMRIDSDDALYEPVLEWVADLVRVRGSQRRLHVITGRSDGETVRANVDEKHREPPVVRTVPGESGAAQVIVAGHRIWVTIGRREFAADDRQYRLAAETLTFRALNEAGRDAVLDAIRQIAAAQASRKPVLRLMNRWGGWDTRSDLPERPLDSVILPRELKSFLVDDLRRFLEAEPEYVRRGIPYHRGYLLHGPPGTGKSSLAQALASHFGLDLWFAGLGDARRDADLIHQLSQVAARSVLLLEDIDVFAAATSRHNDGDGPTMASLLNVLDGVATPHGLITFITTNAKAELDAALVRPGRIDVDVELTAPTWDLAEDLWRWFYGETVRGRDFNRDGWRDLPTSAEIVEIFKRYPEDPAGGNTALLRSTASTGAPV